MNFYLLWNTNSKYIENSKCLFNMNSWGLHLYIYDFWISDIIYSAFVLIFIIIFSPLKDSVVLKSSNFVV